MRPSIPLLLAAQRVRCRTGFFFFAFFWLFFSNSPRCLLVRVLRNHLTHAEVGMSTMRASDYLVFLFFFVFTVSGCCGGFVFWLLYRFFVFFSSPCFLVFLLGCVCFFFNYARLGLGSLYLAHCGFQFRRVLGLARFTEMLLLLLLLLVVVVVVA